MTLRLRRERLGVAHLVEPVDHLPERDRFERQVAEPGIRCLRTTPIVRRVPVPQLAEVEQGFARGVDLRIAVVVILGSPVPAHFRKSARALVGSIRTGNGSSPFASSALHARELVVSVGLGDDAGE